MDERQSVQEFRQRWQAVTAFEIEEQRTTSVDLRWQQLNAIVRLAKGLGLPLEPDEGEEIVHLRWARLKEAWA